MDLKIIDRDNKGQLMKTLALVILGAVLVGCTAAGHNPTDKPKPAATSKGEAIQTHDSVSRVPTHCTSSPEKAERRTPA